MNWSGDDYVLGHVLTASREHPAGKHQLSIDLLTGQMHPSYLAPPPVALAVGWYVKGLPDTVRRSSSDMSLVREASLVLTFDTAVERPHARFSQLLESPFVCEVAVTDTRGKKYIGRVSDWWFPERSRPLPWRIHLRNTLSHLFRGRTPGPGSAG